MVLSFSMKIRSISFSYFLRFHRFEENHRCDYSFRGIFSNSMFPFLPRCFTPSLWQPFFTPRSWFNSKVHVSRGLTRRRISIKVSSKDFQRIHASLFFLFLSCLTRRFFFPSVREKQEIAFFFFDFVLGYTFLQLSFPFSPPRRGYQYVTRRGFTLKLNLTS